MQQLFAFEAVALNGSLDSGTVSADSLNDARQSIASRGLLVVSIEPRGPHRARRVSLGARDLALGLRMLGDLLDSGLSAGRALHAFEELAPRGWRDALPHIRQSVREGRTLAAAFAAAPIEIPGLVVGIAQAGEAGAGAGPAIRRAADLTEATAEMRAAIRSALAYPLVVAVAGVCAITILITVVLPRFARILSDIGQTLPVSTRIVLRAAEVGRAAALPAFLFIGAAAFAWRGWVRTDAGRLKWHRFLLSIPGVRSIRHGAATARMAHSLSALLESGVPIAAALDLAARATADAELESRLRRARAGIAAGQSLSHALSAHDAATPVAIRLVRAGEESGRLPAMLGHAARIEQQRVDHVIRAAVRMLEPALLLLFAGMVGLVAAALLQAIYSVRPA
jgi:type II secretory pathway component PulF